MPIVYSFKGHNLSLLLYVFLLCQVELCHGEACRWVSEMSKLLSAGFELHGQHSSTVAACCLHLMHSVPGGMLSASMCSRLQACLASRGKALHTDTLKIHLSSVTSPAIHGASLSSALVTALLVQDAAQIIQAILGGLSLSQCGTFHWRMTPCFHSQSASRVIIHIIPAKMYSPHFSSIINCSLIRSV